MSELTREQAIDLAESHFWETMDARSIAQFQLYEERLCMPFKVFHKAIEDALGRPVWTHEFALNRDGLKAELAGDRPKPTMEDIIDLLPDPAKVIVVTR